MSLIKDFNQIKNESVADPKAIIKRDKVRFTLLTSRIIRMEYSATNSFLDVPSQVFLYRKQPVPRFEVVDSGDFLEIITEHLHLRYKEREEGFTKWNISIEIKELGAVWHYGDVDNNNLKGSARTLDMSSGKIPLENGLMSRSGWSIIDDSYSLVFNNNGWLEERKKWRERKRSIFFWIWEQLRAMLERLL